MNESIRDLMQPMRVHHAVVVRCVGTDDRLYGRITGFEGTPLDGIHPIIVVHTPGGSVVRSGRAWVRPADEVELATLYGYEFAQRESGRGTYESA